jgi:hypothetical protein
LERVSERGAVLGEVLGCLPGTAQEASAAMVGAQDLTASALFPEDVGGGQASAGVSGDPCFPLSESPASGDSGPSQSAEGGVIVGVGVPSVEDRVPAGIEITAVRNRRVIVRDVPA